MPGYAREGHGPARRNHAIGLKGRVGNAKNAQRQSEFLPGGQKNKHQDKLDTWIAGVDDYEADIQKYRKRRHRFRPMGTTGKCDWCHLSIHARIDDGRKLHTG